MKCLIHMRAYDSTSVCMCISFLFFMNKSFFWRSKLVRLPGKQFHFSCSKKIHRSFFTLFTASLRSSSNLSTKMTFVLVAVCACKFVYICLCAYVYRKKKSLSKVIKCCVFLMFTNALWRSSTRRLMWRFWTLLVKNLKFLCFKKKTKTTFISKISPSKCLLPGRCLLPTWVKCVLPIKLF